MMEWCSRSFVCQRFMAAVRAPHGLCEPKTGPLGATLYFLTYHLRLLNCSVCGWALKILTETTPYASTHTHTFTCAHHGPCTIFLSYVFGHFGNTFSCGLWLILFFCHLWAMFTLHYAEKLLKSSHAPSCAHADSPALSNSVVRMFTSLLISDVRCKRLALSFLKTAVMKLWRNSQGNGAN